MFWDSQAWSLKLLEASPRASWEFSRDSLWGWEDLFPGDIWQCLIYFSVNRTQGSGQTSYTEQDTPFPTKNLPAQHCTKAEKPTLEEVSCLRTPSWKKLCAIKMQWPEMDTHTPIRSTTSYHLSRQRSHRPAHHCKVWLLWWPNTWWDIGGKQRQREVFVLWRQTYLKRWRLWRTDWWGGSLLATWWHRIIRS